MLERATTQTMAARLLGSIETSRVQEGQVSSLALVSTLERIDPVNATTFPQGTPPTSLILN